jgi:hypothetical protein
MLITPVHTTPLWLTFREPYDWAGRAHDGTAVVPVEVETDAGRGSGEG